MNLGMDAVIKLWCWIVDAFVIRNLTAKLALGWRYRLTESLSKLYFQNNAYYKVRWSQIAAFRDYIVIGPYLLTTGSPLSLPAAYECDQQVVK